MNFPQKITGSCGTLWIIPACAEDLPELLSLFDDAVAWLVRRGITQQWGTTAFSEIPQMHKRFMEWIDRGELFVARSDDKLVGTLALSKVAPHYVAHLWQSFPESACYLEAFTTTRSLVGQGIGQALLQWAEHYALQQGKNTMWLDCWADNHALCGYYQRAGFAPRSEFLVGEWRGQLFEKSL
jgi:GNAT superfamily N-acetyltransferase